MLSREDNERLVRVGPGTPMGTLMRLYWMPFLLARDLLADGQPHRVRLLGEDLVAFRDSSSRCGLVDHACPHRGAPLVFARNEDNGLRCMYHGLKFDAAGKCVQIPGQENIPPKLGVRSYPVVERDRLIWIWMGDPAKAGPAKILDFPYLRDTGWRGHPGYLHYDANYLLIVDNLSDFSHLAFVHAKTLGGSEEYAFMSKPAPALSGIQFTRAWPFGT